MFLISVVVNIVYGLMVCGELCGDIVCKVGMVMVWVGVSYLCDIWLVSLLGGEK